MTFVTVIKMEDSPIIPKTREEIRIAAALLDMRFGTVRQWFHRGAIPPLAELQLIDFFGHRFFVTDYPIKTSGRPCLARLAQRYLKK